LITAVIPIRQTEEHSRSWDRLEIGISSLKRFVPSVTSIFVVDSNSDEPWATELVDICERLDVHLWRIDDLDHWNKCKTMNAAMYQAVTPYVMQFDVDMVITTDEVEKAIQAQLEPNIFLTFLIHNLCHQLTCDRVIEEDADKLHEWMKSHSLLRAGGRSTGGIQIFDRTWFLKVRGYDEEYALWGREDDDMVKLII